MSWLAWVGIAVLYLVWCWWRDRQQGQVDQSRVEQETIDFSIYLYTSKRGRGPRWDR